MCDENTRRRKRGVREGGGEETFKAIRTKNFPQINVRHETTDPGCSENNNLLLLLVSNDVP